MHRLKQNFAWWVISSRRRNQFLITYAKFQVEIFRCFVTILQGVEFPIFLLIFVWTLQQCSATALHVIECIDLYLFIYIPQWIECDEKIFLFYFY